MGIVVMVVIGYIIFAAVLHYNDNDPDRLKTRIGQRMQMYKDEFNAYTKRFYKCAYPYTDYLLALGLAQEKGYSTNLTDEQINFYLSYPKKYEFKERGNSGNYDLYVNGFNLGPANECYLLVGKQYLIDEPKIYNKKINKFLENGLKTFYIDKYVIDTDFTTIGDSEENNEMAFRNNYTFESEDKARKAAFVNIENESNEALKDCSNLITKELNSFIDKLQEKDYSTKEMEELYEENNKKWRNDYFSKYTDISKEEFYKDYEHPNIWLRIYEDDGNRIGNELYDVKADSNYNRTNSVKYTAVCSDWHKIYTSHETLKSKEISKNWDFSKDGSPTELEKAEKAAMTEFTDEEKRFKNNMQITNSLENNKIKNVYWDNKYANAIKDIELKYDLKENEPAITTDFRKQHYNHRIARKCIVESALLNPLTGKFHIKYKDGSTLSGRDKPRYT